MGIGIGARPATCTSCGKRLGRKQWYYRNGKYFCKKRCWVTEQEKAAKEAQGAKEAAPEPKANEAAKPEPAKEAKAA